LRILGFDAATRASTVALCDFERGLQVEARDDPPRDERPRHTTRLLAMMIELLEQTATGWDDIDRIAVGVGPGTFTGLRIAVATARALGRARRIPLVGVSTLESLSLNGRTALAQRPGPEGPGCEAVLAVLDARRGEVFAAGWRARGAGQAGAQAPEPPLLSPLAVPPGDLAALLPGLGSGTLAVGDGAVEFRAVLERSGASIPEDESELHRVTAINHCRLAGGLRGSAADEVQPEYLRLPDAEIARRAAGSR
jgi:tRNA threonylcarbamoyladenosine biosynthesis protein TsaB